MGDFYDDEPVVTYGPGGQGQTLACEHMSVSGPVTSASCWAGCEMEAR
jgi:hypothetical protein